MMAVQAAISPVLDTLQEESAQTLHLDTGQAISRFIHHSTGHTAKQRVSHSQFVTTASPDDYFRLEQHQQGGDSLSTSSEGNTCGESTETKHEAMVLTQAPQKTLLGHITERPVSNDSIVTDAAELLSSHLNVSSVSNSCSSRESSVVIEKLHVGASPGSVVKSDITRSGSSVVPALHAKSVDSAPMLDGGSRAGTKTKYMFTKSAKGGSQLSFTNGGALDISKSVSSSSIHGMTTTIQETRHKVHDIPLFAKTTPALVTTPKALTPSQRFRLRREQTKAAVQDSIKSREMFYDEQETLSLHSAGVPVSSSGNSTFVTDELDGSLAQYLSRDVPVASASMTPFLMCLNSSQKVRNHGTKRSLSLERSQSSGILEYSKFPPCPIPGINNVTDLQFFHDTSKALESVYTSSSIQYSKSRLSERSISAEVLPLEFKSASAEGVEDMRLISESKLALCSPSRPSWLPPKLAEERERHEKQIRKTMSSATLKQLDRNKEREARELRDAKNRDKIALILERGVARKSSHNDLKKICWESSLHHENRLEIYRRVLQGDGTKVIEEEFIDDLSHLNSIYCNIKYPHAKLKEIEAILSRLPCMNGEEPSEDFIYVMQLKAISSQGLQIGDELLFYHFLKTGHFSVSEVWTLVNLLQLTCFSEGTKEKYDKHIISSSGVVGRYLNVDQTFAKEFNLRCLNFMNWWNFMARLHHSLFMWCMDIIVIEHSQLLKSDSLPKPELENGGWETYRSKHLCTNYKILCSLALNVLLNYHFGYNDFHELPLVDKSFKIVDQETHLTEGAHASFVRKWRHYYRKF